MLYTRMMFANSFTIIPWHACVGRDSVVIMGVCVCVCACVNACVCVCVSTINSSQWP